MAACLHQTEDSTAAGATVFINILKFRAESPQSGGKSKRFGYYRIASDPRLAGATAHKLGIKPRRGFDCAHHAQGIVK
jgi:hypothetical protein